MVHPVEVWLFRHEAPATMTFWLARVGLPYNIPQKWVLIQVVLAAGLVPRATIDLANRVIEQELPAYVPGPPPADRAAAAAAAADAAAAGPVPAYAVADPGNPGPAMLMFNFVLVLGRFALAAADQAARERLLLARLHMEENMAERTQGRVAAEREAMRVAAEREAVRVGEEREAVRAGEERARDADRAMGERQRLLETIARERAAEHERVAEETRALAARERAVAEGERELEEKRRKLRGVDEEYLHGYLMIKGNGHTAKYPKLLEDKGIDPAGHHPELAYRLAQHPYALTEQMVAAAQRWNNKRSSPLPPNRPYPEIVEPANHPATPGNNSLVVREALLREIEVEVARLLRAQDDAELLVDHSQDVDGEVPEEDEEEPRLSL